MLSFYLCKRFGTRKAKQTIVGMRIKQIKLVNFRNYTEETIDFGGRVNIFVGSNGQGKSALVEAVYILAVSKSHRTTRDGDLVKVGSDWCRVSGCVETDKRGELDLGIIIKRGGKKYVEVNKVRRQKVGDIVGHFNAVVFSSADIRMVSGEPVERRRFMNFEISQISPQYMYALGRYKRVLEQRNALLKESRQGNSLGMLDALNEQIVNYGCIMMEKRAQYVKGVAVEASDIYGRLCGGSECLEISYMPSVGCDESSCDRDGLKESFADALNHSIENDLARGTTTKGPHRDDISIRVNGMDLRYFGSQGQQRSAAVAIKLAEVAIVEKMIGERPVLLLDDIASELDEDRRRRVFDIVGKDGQVIVTAAAMSELPEEVICGAAVYSVTSGKVGRLETI